MEKTCTADTGTKGAGGAALFFGFRTGQLQRPCLTRAGETTRTVPLLHIHRPVLLTYIDSSVWNCVELTCSATCTKAMYYCNWSTTTLGVCCTACIVTYLSHVSQAGACVACTPCIAWVRLYRHASGCLCMAKLAS